MVTFCLLPFCMPDLAHCFFIIHRQGNHTKSWCFFHIHPLHPLTPMDKEK